MFMIIKIHFFNDLAEYRNLSIYITVSFMLQ